MSAKGNEPGPPWSPFYNALRVRIALIGSGSIAAAHARALRRIGESDAALNLQLVAVVGREQAGTDHFAREHGIDWATTEFDRVVESADIDATIVCSPSAVHAEQSRRALLAGKHVLCEIPVALSLAEADELAALAAAHGRILMVCHTQRYYPALVEARRLIAEGALHPHALIARYGFLRRENVNWMGRRRTWTDDLIWHHGGHAVDTALWLLGHPVAAVRVLIAQRDDRLGIPLDYGILLRTVRDQIVTIAMSYNTHIAVHDYLVVGEERSIQYVDGELRDASGTLVPRPGSGPVSEPIVEQDHDFLRAACGQRACTLGVGDIRPSLEALQVLQQEFDRRNEGHHPRYP